jgi:type IV secretory pathway TrbL component
MLAWQAIERKCLFHIVLDPIAQLRIAGTPFLQPGSQIFARFLNAAPIVDPAQLGQTIVVCFPRPIVERIA